MKNVDTAIKFAAKVAVFESKQFILTYDNGDKLYFSAFGNHYILDGEDKDGTPIYGGASRDPEWVSKLILNDMNRIVRITY